MGTRHHMATLKCIDSVTSFPQIICYIVVFNKVFVESIFLMYSREQGLSCHLIELSNLK